MPKVKGMRDGVEIEIEEADLARPGPMPPLPVDPPTLSDWRVALVQMGRLDGVLAAVKARKDAGDVAGAIAWERLEYANHVYRAELVQLAPTFGFTIAEIDQSLELAAQIAASIQGAASLQP